MNRKEQFQELYNNNKGFFTVLRANMLTKNLSEEEVTSRINDLIVDHHQKRDYFLADKFFKSFNFQGLRFDNKGELENIEDVINIINGSKMLPATVVIIPKNIDVNNYIFEYSDVSRKISHFIYIDRLTKKITKGVKFISEVNNQEANNIIELAQEEEYFNMFADENGNIEKIAIDYLTPDQEKKFKRKVNEVFKLNEDKNQIDFSASKKFTFEISEFMSFALNENLDKEKGVINIDGACDIIDRFISFQNKRGEYAYKILRMKSMTSPDVIPSNVAKYLDYRLTGKKLQDGDKLENWINYISYHQVINDDSVDYTEHLYWSTYIILSKI